MFHRFANTFQYSGYERCDCPQMIIISCNPRSAMIRALACLFSALLLAALPQQGSVLAVLTHFSNHKVLLFLLFNLASVRFAGACSICSAACMHSGTMLCLHSVHTSCQLDGLSSRRIGKSSCLVKAPSTTSQQECLHQDRPRFRVSRAAIPISPASCKSTAHAARAGYTGCRWRCHGISY